MAEAIVGFVASVATLLKIAAGIEQLVHRVKDAPQEIAQVGEELVHLQAQGQLIARIHENNPLQNIVLHQPILQAYELSVQQSKAKIDHLSDTLRTLASNASGARGRLKWIVSGHSEARSLLSNVQSTRSALAFTLELSSYMILSSYQSSHTVSDVYSAQGTTAGQLIGNSKLDSDNDPSKKSNIVQTSKNESLTMSSGLFRQETWKGQTSMPVFGNCLRVLATRQPRKRHCTFGISFHLELPFSLVLLGSVFVRVFYQSCLNFRILRGSSLGLTNLISSDSTFLIACANGDLSTMTYMLQERLASPNDTTLRGFTPISHAISNGQIEAVKILIHEGADVDAVFGENQTSPLAWAIKFRRYDIARLLLHHDASCQHVTGYGWTPLFYLWEGEDPSMPVVSEILSMLTSRPDFVYSHTGILDMAGFGLIHRATIFGTSMQVVKLLSAGVDSSTQQGPFRWNAIQNAVAYGQLDTLKVLITYDPKFDVNMRDERGWTLLHISAAEGDNDINRLLLKLGADWKALTFPKGFGDEDLLRGKSSTPAETAAAYGADSRSIFLRAVRDLHGTAGMSKDELEELDEVWTDANESFLLLSD